ncbi:hypothetical protein B1T52_27820 [Mycobacterium kansasii]|nr:hypothetical protein B1T52_27820 [Mycobacterium kansasii]
MWSPAIADRAVPASTPGPTGTGDADVAAPATIAAGPSRDAAVAAGTTSATIAYARPTPATTCPTGATGSADSAGPAATAIAHPEAGTAVTARAAGPLAEAGAAVTTGTAVAKP